MRHEGWVSLPETLPIATIRALFLAAKGPVVITAPTGSGKSTEVPRWCLARGDSVVVVEPRRVACRALAARVAHLEGCALGDRVGYQVRDENCESAATRLRFITPGIALRQLDRLLAADVVILDELHERRLEVDLLLALLRRARPQLIAMSATLDAQKVQDYLGGAHLEAPGRLHPVEVRHRDGGLTLPSASDLSARVAAALDSVADVPGDVLVFLPGKGEIADLEQTLGGRPLEIVPLHGGLSLERQSRVFRSAKRRKVVLATNVAETSLTVPGIGVVIDSGLVRRTAFHRGRAHLALHPIALDAAEQRAGRAGRTGPGVAVRLWARRADLGERTPPEVHRESLVPLLLGAAAAGHRLEDLAFLDEPKSHAVEAARAELEVLGALDDAGAITAIGLGLHGLPLDAPLGRLLLEARESADEALLQDTVDLVAALATGRPFFSGPPSREPGDPRATGCDATAFVRAVRGPGGDPARRDARRTANRLRDALGLGAPQREGVDAAGLRRLALRADPRSAHLARRRKRRVAFSNGGTEVDLARESAAWLGVEPAQGEREVEAVVVFEERAFGRGRDRRLLATCASPVSLQELREAGVGCDQLGAARVVRGKVVATLERVFAGRVLAEREAVPEGEAAREAMAELFLAGRIHRKSRAETQRRLALRTLAARLADTRLGKEQGLPALEAPPPLATWIRERLVELGVESGADLKLLAAEDFLAEELPFEIRHGVEDTFPREVDLGDALYRAVYELDERRVRLELVRGTRSKPPSKAFLPAFGGLTILVEAGGTFHRVR